jgi:hypothetical protein
MVRMRQIILIITRPIQAYQIKLIFILPIVIKINDSLDVEELYHLRIELIANLQLPNLRIRRGYQSMGKALIPFLFAPKNLALFRFL